MVSDIPMKTQWAATLTFLCFFIFGGSIWAAKIPVKIKSLFQFESEQKVTFELKCLTRDNTEIYLQGSSPSEHVIFTAKRLDRCEIKKEGGKPSIRLRLVEGKITDELKKLSVITEKTILKTADESALILISPVSPDKKAPKKKRLSAKRQSAAPSTNY